MPDAIRYEPDPESTAARMLDDAYSKETDARAKVYKRHWQYYDGKMHKPLTIEQDSYDDNVMLPKVDQIADKIVALLFGSGVDWQVGADDAEGADDVVEELWEANNAQRLLHNIGLSGAMAGHVFVRLVPRVGDWPKIVNLNPSNVGIFWDAMDVDRVLWYRLQYVAGTMGRRIDYIRGRLDGERWNHDADGWTERVYELDARWKLVSEEPWDYEWAPIVEWQNNPRPFVAYGLDDVSKAVALNDAVNFVASNYNRILKHHASPKTIGLGFSVEDLIATSIGGFYTVNKPSNEANIYNLEMQSDLASSREFLALLMREVWQSSRLVDPQTVKDSIGQLTNFGLRVMFADTLGKIEAKRTLYEDGLIRVSTQALELAGKPLNEVLSIRWPDVLPEDNVEVATVLLKELEAGVLDRETYSEIRGRDWAEISERLEEERAGEASLGEQLLTSFARGSDFGGQATRGTPRPPAQARRAV